MTDRIFRVVVTNGAGRPVLCKLDSSPKWPTLKHSFWIGTGQTLDVTGELGEDHIDPADRVQHVRLARIMAAHRGLSSVRLERRELPPWQSVEFKRTEEPADG